MEDPYYQPQPQAFDSRDVYSRPNAYDQTGIDSIIVSNNANATEITRKVPRFVKKTIYALDEEGNKIPATDEKGNIKTNEKGEVQYMIAGYEKIRKGWTFRKDVLPATEIFNPDITSANIPFDIYLLAVRLIRAYNTVVQIQALSDEDYSLSLHKLYSNLLAIIIPSKSISGTSVQAVKTYYTKTESTQTQADLTPQNQPGLGGFDKFREWVKRKPAESRGGNPVAWQQGTI